MNNQFFRHCRYVLWFATAFVIGLLLIEWITGDNIKNTNWVYRILEGIALGISMRLIDIYQRKKRRRN